MNADAVDLPGPLCNLRALRASDAASLSRHADDEQVWRNLFDGFPRPYTLADAEWCGAAKAAGNPNATDRRAPDVYTPSTLSKCTTMTLHLAELLTKNREWAEATEARSPGFFTNLLKQQEPQYLWIGCADSRVPANELVGLAPGELFVHRNIANVVAHSDLNCLSVIQFATDKLLVKHLIVVGHSACAGVSAALLNKRVGIADNWIRHVQDVRDQHLAWLDTVPKERRVDALCELNVIEQARNVCRTTIVQDAWHRGQELVVHGWFYGLHNGLLQDLTINVAGAGDMAAAYETAIAGVHERYAARAA